MSSNLPIEDLGVGGYLAQERQERGISLAEVSEKTCIRINFLEKIEVEDFGQLPSVPVARGFVRSYAKYIGVDADEVVRFYNQKVGARSEDIDPELGSKILYSKAVSDKESKRLLVPILVVVLFILASGTGLWFVRGKTASLGYLIGFTAPPKETDRIVPDKPTSEKRKVTVEKAAPSNEPSSEKKKESGSQAGKPEIRETSSLKKAAETPVVSAALPAEPLEGTVPITPSLSVEDPTKSSARAVPRNSRLILKIKAEEDTWLRVIVDQEEASEIFLTAGNEKLWPGNDKFLLTVGNAKGTTVFLNDSVISLPKTTSNVIRDFLITDKVAEFKPGIAGN